MNEKMTIKQLLQVHNEVAAKLELPALKTWSKPKSNLMARIRGLQSELPAEAKPTPRKRQDGDGRPSMKAFIEGLIHEGLDDQSILARCREEFPDTDWDHRRTYPRWYRNAMDRKARKAGDAKGNRSGQP